MTHSQPLYCGFRRKTEKYPTDAENAFLSDSDALQQARRNCTYSQRCEEVLIRVRPSKCAKTAAPPVTESLYTAPTQALHGHITDLDGKNIDRNRKAQFWGILSAYTQHVEIRPGTTGEPRQYLFTELLLLQKVEEQVAKEAKERQGTRNDLNIGSNLTQSFNNTDTGRTAEIMAKKMGISKNTSAEAAADPQARSEGETETGGWR